MIESRNILLLEQVVADFQRASTWHLDHHLSAAFEQVARFALEMLFEKDQCTFGVIVQENTHQLDDVFLLENDVKRLLHGIVGRITNPPYAVSNAFASQVVTSAGAGIRPVDTTFSLITRPGVERML